MSDWSWVAGPHYDYLGNSLEFPPKPPKPSTSRPIPKEEATVKVTYVDSKVNYQTEKNVLNNFRSYTYRFTLAALKNKALEDAKSFQTGVNGRDFFVVLQSGGKGTSGFDVLNVDDFDESTVNYRSSWTNPETGKTSTERKRGAIKIQTQAQESRRTIKDNKSTIEGFNKESSGRFDFFMDNVTIDIIPSGSEKTNMSMATSIEFEVREQYSMTGFIEAIHVASLAAGHDSYMNSPFLLKVDFIGYKDDEEKDRPVVADFSTRNFIIRFVEINIDVSDEGAIYKCKAIPQNEQGLGQPSQLVSDIAMSGSPTVRVLLDNFMENLTKSKQAEAAEFYKNENTSMHDSFSIVFPVVTEQGINTEYLEKPNYTPNKIVDGVLSEVLSSNAIYKFPDIESTEDQEERLIKYDPTNPVIFFAQGNSVLDCVASVVRDSTYVKNILKNPVIDTYGMVDYFFIHIEAVKKEVFDEKNNREFFHYRYVVIPYKIHYTRVQPRISNLVDTKKITNIVHREYNYFYTGYNVDVQKFELKFNTLFYQAVPKLLGNQPGRPDSSGVQAQQRTKTSLPTSQAPTTPIGIPPTKPDAAMNAPTQSGMPNATATSSDPYDYLVKSLHQAILENVDQCTGEMEIIGDPYYLTTMGVGNLKHSINSDGTVGLKEAPCYFGDVHILFKFRNPKDLNRKTGLMEFDSRVALYSGLFRVIGIKNSFNGGVFTQKLDLIRIPMQPEDVGINVESPPRIGLDGEPDQEFAPVTAEQFLPSGFRADTDSLVASLASLPITGLPGALSSLLPGAQSIAGSINTFATIGTLAGGLTAGLSGATTAIGNVVNQIQSGVNQGLSNVSSAIRLATSGLSDLSQTINSSGGSADQISKSLNAVGLKQSTPENLAGGLLNLKPGNSNQLGNQAMSQVQSLSKNAGGLMSNVFSKIDGLNGKTAALAGQLGIKLDSISGLSNDLQTQLVKKISDAAASIPSDVDVTAYVKEGLELNNIPTNKLPNIPASQPKATAPPPRVNREDIANILRRGGSLANIPGASKISDIQGLVASASLSAGVVIDNPLDSPAIASKVSAIQNQLQSVIGKVSSVESNIQAVQSVSRTALPNTTPAPSSVINIFGSTQETSSPLLVVLNNSALSEQTGIILDSISSTRV